MDDQLSFFFQRKKLKLQELRIARREEAKQARRNAWARKLQPLGSIDRQCCQKQCVNGGIPLELLTQTRKKFLEFNDQCARKQHVMDMLDIESPSGFSVVEKLHTICWTGMNLLFGVSNALLQSVQATPGARAPPMARRLTRLGYATRGLWFSKADIITTWLMMLAAVHCVQPDKDEIHLPYGRKRHVWRVYMDESAKNPEEFPPCPENKFIEYWNERCPHIKQIEEELQRASTPADRKLWRQAKQIHQNYVRVERHGYHYRVQRAIHFQDALSMVADGAFNGDYSHPYFCQVDKDSCGGVKHKHRLIACMIHGHFTCSYQFSAHQVGGTNAMIECIQRTLETFIQQGHKLPPTFFLQLDNTAKECKNRKMLAYLKSLIDNGVFEEVYLNFLPVGHTHCDIDQLFSRISVFLRAFSAYNFDEMSRALKLACSRIQFVDKLDSFMNFAESVEDDLNDASKTPGLQHFQDFRVFKFFKKEYEVTKHGRTSSKTVGVLQCKSDFLDTAFHDTRNDTTAVIPLCKNHLKTFKWENFYAKKNKMKPYVIEPLATETISKLEEGLNACKDRIYRTRGNADEIINDLQLDIDKFKMRRVYPFQWRRATERMFTNPPKLAAEEIDLSEEQIAMLEEVVKDKARKRLEEEMGCQIVKFPREVYTGQFVVLQAPEDKPEPFYIAQVLQNLTDIEKLRIHWHEPTAASKSRTSKYENMYFQEEMDNQKISGRQHGRRMYKVIPRVDDIEWATVHFGFSKLKNSGGLPAEVLRQLKLLGIITGKVKRM